MSKSPLHGLIVMTCTALLMAACNSASTNSSADSSDSSSDNCPHVSPAEVTAAWGKPVTVTFFQIGKQTNDHCMFVPTDSSDKDYLDVVLQDQTSADNAKLFMKASAGVKGAETVTGIGDEALFTVSERPDKTHGIDLTVRKDKYVVIVDEFNAPESNRPVLDKIAQIVLAKIGKS